MRFELVTSCSDIILNCVKQSLFFKNLSQQRIGVFNIHIQQLIVMLNMFTRVEF